MGNAYFKTVLSIWSEIKLEIIERILPINPLPPSDAFGNKKKIV